MRHDPAAPVPAAPPRHTSRRWFLRTVGAASAVLPFAPLVTAGALAQPPAANPPTTPAVPAPAPPPAPDASSEFAADARTLAELVERRFGARLSATDKDAVRADLQDGLESGRTLRNLDLSNADEPDVIFQARAVED